MAHTLVANVVAHGFAEHQCAAGDWAAPADFFDVDTWEDHLKGLTTEWDTF